MVNLSESLPDFDDMDRMARIIADAKANIEDRKNKLDEFIAICIQDAMTNQEYWINGKPPTIGYCMSVVAIKGNTAEDFLFIRNVKEEIVKYTKVYQESKALLDNMKDRIAVWQTSCVNARKANY